MTRQIFVYTGDLGLAQDLVQEAFCRALPRWSKVSGYDDPVAWIRRVAVNLEPVVVPAAVGPGREDQREHPAERHAHHPRMAGRRPRPVLPERKGPLQQRERRERPPYPRREPGLRGRRWDGAPEALVLVSCNSGGIDYKVLALDRAADGKIVTLGQVVGSVGSGGPRGTIRSIWGVGAGGGGQVRVEVGDYGPPCCQQAAASQHQWRTYGWNGTHFTQTGGPTTFGANPKVTDLSATSKGLTMTKQPDGTWRGTLTVIVRNAAAFVTPGPVQLIIDVPTSWKMTPSGCTLVPNENPTLCWLPAVAKLASRTVTVTLTAPAGNLDAQCHLFVSSVTSAVCSTRRSRTWDRSTCQ